MATDLQFASNAAVVSRGGSRQEVVDRLLSAWDTSLAPPVLEIAPNPRRVELVAELRPLQRQHLRERQAIRKEVEDEYRERIAATEDNDERGEAATETRWKLEDRRHEIELEVARRIELSAPGHSRAAEIRAALAEIDRADTQLIAASRVKLATTMRRVLATPLAPEGIMQALDRLAGQHKWQPAIDRRTCLAVMAEQIEAEGFCAQIVAKAVQDSARKYDWMPSINQFLNDCREIARALFAQVWLLESKDPTKYRDLLCQQLEGVVDDEKRKAERERLKRGAFNFLRAFNLRDRAPPKYP